MLVTAEVVDNDGLANVLLEYQVVHPGRYVAAERFVTTNLISDPNAPREPNPEYVEAFHWQSVPMFDDGTGVDEAANDGVYSAEIPSQAHRRLVRYRIVVTDALGAEVSVPYADDPSKNLAYFVYDAVPAWRGSPQPGAAAEVTYSSELLESVATYHFITSRQAHEDALFLPDSGLGSGYTGSGYLWQGAFVYDGEVYDHIRYRARGGVWRYSMGKNMWKFDFNRGKPFQAHDDYGRAYTTQWDKLNFSALIQQGNYLHRGEQGLFESVGFRLFNLAGVESPHTHYVHFRVVESSDEDGRDQYSGDFQGLYLAIEQPDGRLLEEHGLPDGNLYKIESDEGTSNNQGPTQVSDGSDVAQFISTYLSVAPDEAWWRENLDLDRYYSYRTIVEGIHHYDIAGGKNYYYYHNPATDKFQVHPWDLDLTWADNMFGSGRHTFVGRVAENPAFNREFQNRVRELRDLLYNEEQTGWLIDEVAAHVYQEGQLSFVDADRAMWDFNPILTSSYINAGKAGHGRYYEQSPTGDFAGMIRLMKDYVESRSAWMDSTLLTEDADTPQQPVLTYVGGPGYPASDLHFETTPFESPTGAEFRAMEWRLAEVTDPESAGFDPLAPRKYEIEADWESGEWSTFRPSVRIPAGRVTPGSTYRVRVRMQDDAGRWSHWAEPIQLEVTSGDPATLAQGLRVSEVQFHPADPTALEASQGHTDADDFEYLEFVNVGVTALDVSSVELAQTSVGNATQGVAFSFADSRVHTLLPGERVVVVENLAAFEARYGTGRHVAGEWSGGLSNNREQLTVLAFDEVVQQFTYDDDWHPATDGGGPALEIVDATAPLTAWNTAQGWRASPAPRGTPGLAPSEGVPGDVDRDGDVDGQDIDRLFLEIRLGGQEAVFDLTRDSQVDQRDVDLLVHTILGSRTGDADLNGAVTVADDGQAVIANLGRHDAGWEDGDFDGDGWVTASKDGALLLAALAADGSVGDFPETLIDRILTELPPSLSRSTWRH